ncbi:MAG: hypothetical protein RR308_01030 [Hafnia sp.]
MSNKRDFTALREKIKNKRKCFDTQTIIDVDLLEALLDELEAAEKLAEVESRGADEVAACGIYWLKKFEAAEKRIAELEAKLANPVLLPKTNGYWNEQEKAYEEAITLAKRQVRLAGFRCEEDE